MKKNYGSYYEYRQLVKYMKLITHYRKRDFIDDENLRLVRYHLNEAIVNLECADLLICKDDGLQVDENGLIGGEVKSVEDFRKIIRR